MSPRTTLFVAESAATLLGFALIGPAATRRGVSPARPRGAALAGALVYVCAARLLVVVFHLGPFASHPWWVLGLAPSFGQAVAAVALALGAVLLYSSAWSVPWRPVLDALVPGGLLALAVVQLGQSWAGVDRDGGKLAVCSLLSCVVAFAPLPRSSAGAPARAGLFVAGVYTLVFALRHPAPYTPLVAGLYTPAQAWAVLAILSALAIRVRRSPA